MQNQLETVNYQIIHQTYGRIRLKIPLLKQDSSYGDRLQYLIKSLTGVQGIEINSLTASLLVVYNPNLVNNATLQQALINCLQQANLIETSVPRETVKSLENPETNISETSERITSDLIDIFQALGFSLSPGTFPDISEFPTYIDQENKLLEIGIPAIIILATLNDFLDDFEKQHRQDTDTKYITLSLEATLKEGGLIIEGKAQGKFRQKFGIYRWQNYSPWISITATGFAELEASIINETLHFNLTQLNIFGEEGKWHDELVEYAFEFLFKKKLINHLNDAVANFNGSKFYQFFLTTKDKENKQIKIKAIEAFLSLLEINARLSPDYLWISIYF